MLKAFPALAAAGWYDASILGRAKRGDGLLRNELYIGRLVWRRRTNAKDPMSGKKRSTTKSSSTMRGFCACCRGNRSPRSTGSECCRGRT